MVALLIVNEKCRQRKKKNQEFIKTDVGNEQMY